MHKHEVAVVTGDVNASSNLSEIEARKLEYLLNNCFSEVVSKLQSAECEGFTNFRGDSWQFVVGNPIMAVRATLLFRSLLISQSILELKRKLHSSASIGFGSIRFLPTDSSSAGGGPAYEMSGKRLDLLRKRMPGIGVAGLGDKDQYFDSILGVIDALTRNWTALQAKAVSFALQNYSQLQISNRWSPPISQQAINKHLISAGWPAIKPALLWIETILEGCFLNNNLSSE